MQNGGTAKQVARRAALVALFLIPLTPLLVADTYFFPFITGKAFYFRILVEIAVAAWAVLALLDKEYRPRFSLAGAAVTAFVAWMFVADAFAPNAAKAFWSNFERMEGWVFLIHLLGFFFVASAVLRAEKKWRAWFLTSLGVSVVVCIYALFQLGGSLAIHQGSTRIDATFGNSAYLAIYLLFNVFIALWLALTERRAWLKWSLLALAALEGALIFFTETRGAVLGFVGALALAALLTAATAGKRARGLAAGALVLLILLTGSFYLARNSSFIQENHVLQRIASISLNDGATRFTIWSMAFKGVIERPLTGYGQEGFNYIFNTYYDPSLYAQEQWFDRAHNAFIDWLTAGGIPAFLLYFALFGSAIALLWRSSELSRGERIALTAALVGYAAHNLFVFDNLYSYVYFFAILALIDSQTARPLARLEDAPELSVAGGMVYALPIAAVSAVALIWLVNVSGMRAASELIVAMSPSADVSKNLAVFEYFAKHPPFAMQEIREQMVSFAGAVAQNQSVPNEQKRQAASLAVIEMRKQVASYPLDARGRLQLSYAYRIAGDAASALKEIESAIILSPKKAGFYIEKGAIEWDVGDIQSARKDFNTAYELAPQSAELAVYSAAGNIAAGNKAESDRILMKVFGTTAVDNTILAVAYYRTEDWPSLITMLTLRTDKPDAGAPAWFSLASAYYMAGDKANARKTINAAVARYPEAAAAGAEAIRQIEAGSAPR